VPQLLPSEVLCNFNNPPEFTRSSFTPSYLLESITSGTDILSLFCSGCPILPFYKGEIHCRSLGMAVSVFDYAGNDVSASGEPRDLFAPLLSQHSQSYSSHLVLQAWRNTGRAILTCSALHLAPWRRAFEPRDWRSGHARPQ
jgi:hypothetical protein